MLLGLAAEVIGFALRAPCHLTVMLLVRVDFIACFFKENGRRATSLATRSIVIVVINSISVKLELAGLGVVDFTTTLSILLDQGLLIEILLASQRIDP